MSVIKALKGMVENVPYPIGKIMARVPFSWRLGHVYGRTKNECAEAEPRGEDVREAYAVEKFREVFEYAREKFPCYRELYERAGVLDLKIETAADIVRVPIVDKQWVRRHFNEFKGVYRLNTGGSSGEPTAFWMDGECWAREWGHFHYMWGQAGYKYTDLKLAIRGKNLGQKPFVYNPVHNEYVINTYLNVKDYSKKLESLFEKRRPKWFHGYPSSIYQFIVECESAFGTDEVKRLFRSVKGLLLSSEYPYPYMLEKFSAYNLSFVSWYGHSEMCVLAYGEVCSAGNGNHGIVYHPFVTYGMSEVIDGHLVGTSYNNFAMPLIRYDTGDLVEAVGHGDVKLNGPFKIKEGRNGDFIEDMNGKMIPLTALIFGRHHKAFDIADYIQIRQDEPGKATLYVTIKNGKKEEMKCFGDNLCGLFDLTNVAIDFDFKVLEKPIRTNLGKLKLKV